ncbi:hypothetical protein [Planctomicrobium piriforme]|nr:hypothetical protein [Planctomicrobium piriforme]
MTREVFLMDPQGKTFADVSTAAPELFDLVLKFFSDGGRQLRMEEAEIHHDRAPLSGVVRELEADPQVDQFLSSIQPEKTQRLRQAIGVIVRIIMEQRGWQKTGRKGSLGIRADRGLETPIYNRGGLSFWFVRAERYELAGGMPFTSVRLRSHRYASAPPALAKIT